MSKGKKERLIAFYADRCIQCHSCEVACQLENNTPAGIRLRRVGSFEKGRFPEAKKFYISSACFHCNSPACASACPAGALVRREDGTVNHLQDRCIGCGYCIQACPFKVPQFNPAQNIMRKCSFCTQRIDRGLEPACVAKCTTKALAYHADGNIPAGFQSYGRTENLHMIYKLVHRAEEYGLPVPVPLNTLTENQLWMWLSGLLPAIGMTFVLVRMARKIEEDKVDE